MTESYGSRRDPPEKDVPFCTLKSFPNQIQHTIQWARDKFENLFSLKPQQLNKLLSPESSPDAIIEVRSISQNCSQGNGHSTLSLWQELRSQPGNKLKNAQYTLKILENRPKSFDNCVVYARTKFEKYFSNKILQLLYNFPLDMTTKEGTPFWSGPKRFALA